MNAIELREVAILKRGARATWAAGDYPAIAARDLWEEGRRLVRRVGVLPGEDVLDVGCGTGNAAIPAAENGACVVGLDLTPELLGQARRLAAKAGVQVEWVQGDAEALPYDDESFDTVLSVFACMFAPRHAVVARELARVLRPGGRMAITGWTPDGAIGQMFRILGAHLPRPSPLAQPAVLWGSELHVRELFAGTDVEVEFELATAAAPPYECGEAAVAFYEMRFGPLMMSRELIQAAGRWHEVRAQLVDLFDREVPMDYLVTLGRKAL